MTPRILLASLVLATAAVAAPSADPTALVPGGVVVHSTPTDLKVRTPAGTVVEIDRHADGSLDDVEGDASTGGDVFTPGDGLRSLAEIVKAVAAPGRTVAGDWSFDHSPLHGWVYELDAFDGGQKVELTVRATDGALLSTEIDD